MGNTGQGRAEVRLELLSVPLSIFHSRAVTGSVFVYSPQGQVQGCWGSLFCPSTASLKYPQAGSLGYGSCHVTWLSPKSELERLLVLVSLPGQPGKVVLCLPLHNGPFYNEQPCSLSSFQGGLSWCWWSTPGSRTSPPFRRDSAARWGARFHSDLQ